MDTSIIRTLQRGPKSVRIEGFHCTYEFERYLRSRKGSEDSRTDHESDCSACYSLTTWRQKISASSLLCGRPLAICRVRVLRRLRGTNLFAASSTAFALCILQHYYSFIHHEGDAGTRLVIDIPDVGHFNYSNLPSCFYVINCARL